MSNTTDGAIAATAVPPEELERLMDGLERHAMGRLKGGTTTTFIPTLHILTGDHPHGPSVTEIWVLDVPFNEAAEKRDLLRGIGRRLCQDKKFPFAVALATEAWQAPAAKGVEPRHNPARREVIIAFGCRLGVPDADVARELPFRRTAEGAIEPCGEFAPVSATIRANILRHLFVGFFESTAVSMGLKL